MNVAETGEQCIFMRIDNFENKEKSKERKWPPNGVFEKWKKF